MVMLDEITSLYQAVMMMMEKDGLIKSESKLNVKRRKMCDNHVHAFSMRNIGVRQSDLSVEIDELVKLVWEWRRKEEVLRVGVEGGRNQ